MRDKAGHQKVGAAHMLPLGITRQMQLRMRVGPNRGVVVETSSNLGRPASASLGFGPLECVIQRPISITIGLLLAASPGGTG